MTTPRRSLCSSRKACRAIATVAPAAAVQLRDEYGLSLLAIDDGPDAFDVEVDRTEQCQAIRCHQHDDDPAVSSVCECRAAWNGWDSTERALADLGRRCDGP